MNSCKDCIFGRPWADGETIECTWRPPVSIRKAVNWTSDKLYTTTKDDYCSEYSGKSM